MPEINKEELHDRIYSFIGQFIHFIDKKYIEVEEEVLRVTHREASQKEHLGANAQDQAHKSFLRPKMELMC